MLAHNVAALLKSPPGTVRKVEIDEPSPALGPEWKASGPLRGGARFIRTQAGILAHAHVRGVFALECARCLEPFEWPVEVDFDEEYLPSISLSTGAPLPTSEDDAVRIDERHVLDLSEIMRQYLATAIPIQPVCRPDCAGICPGCGADLNTTSCGCAPGFSSDQFGALAVLLSQDDASERPQP